MIIPCEEKDFSAIYEIINDAATAYKGIIPADCWHEPYMTEGVLRRQIEEGVHFWACVLDGEISGVMGIQDKGAVTLIRHAYVRTGNRNRGIGTALLHYLCQQTAAPVLIGTWAAATWAISFYGKHGFRLLSASETPALLRKYWTIPERQLEASVVLASADWKLREPPDNP